MKRLRLLMAVALVLVTCTASSKAIYMSGKAWLAQVLLVKAWHENINPEEINKPWPWADIYPVALLEIPRLKIQQVVLNDHSGEAMAFGPGLISSEDAVVLAGHRDSHFEYLQELKTNDKLVLSSRNGVEDHYRVIERQIINTETTKEIRPQADMLVLTTCYPFNASQAGGPLRYLVIAEKIDSAEYRKTALVPHELKSQGDVEFFKF